jgi:hypothetical protein
MLNGIEGMVISPSEVAEYLIPYIKLEALQCTSQTPEFPPKLLSRDIEPFIRSLMQEKESE